MDAQMIRDDIRKLVSEGKTTYENCEKLVLLKKTLKCLGDELEAVCLTGDIHSGDTPLTKAEAVAWVGEMENADGTRGGHWTMDQTEQFRKQRGFECDPLKFYVTMNMMYSDYCKAAEKVNASSTDFYVYMSKAFLDDKDAQPDKLERYYNCIVRK